MSQVTARIEDHFAELTDPRRREVTYPLINVSVRRTAPLFAGLAFGSSSCGALFSGAFSLFGSQLIDFPAVVGVADEPAVGEKVFKGFRRCAAAVR